MSQTPQTLWGLNVIQLHDRYWASRGVQVVRPGSPVDSIKCPELYLLLDQDAAVLMSFDRLTDWLLWSQPDLLWIKLRDPRKTAVPTDPSSVMAVAPSFRLALTSSAKLAGSWSLTTPGPKRWKELRNSAKTASHLGLWVWGRSFSGSSDAQCQDLAMTLLGSWRWPDLAINGIKEEPKGVWSDKNAQIDKTAKVKGPTWIGVRRNLGPNENIEKPTILWDAVSEPRLA